jgi:tetratricopeptide (TPR) repeat protein
MSDDSEGLESAADERLAVAADLHRRGEEFAAIELANAVAADAVVTLVGALWSVGQWSAARMDWTEALDAFDTLASLPLADIELVSGVESNRAWVLAHLDQGPEAVEAARMSIDLLADRPPNARLLLNLAFALSKANQRADALNVILEAVSIDPNDSDVAYDAACHFAALGESTKALTFLERALNLDPNLSAKAIYDEDLSNLAGEPRTADAFNAIIAKARTWPADPQHA